MATYPADVWCQLKGLTADDLIRALERDGWIRDDGSAHLAFIKSPRRATIHYHPRKTYQENLLKGLLTDIGWSVDDLVRLKLVKLRGQRGSSSR